jgi:hypothetical protein
MNTFTCDDKQTLVAYLYGEADTATRAQVEAHLAACEACAAEVTALGDVRGELSLWVPPEVELGFQIVKKSEQPPAQVLRPARWWSTVPAWTQAAAAVLMLGIGLGAANVRIQSGPEGVSVSTGWMAPPAQPALSEPIDGDAIDRRIERELVALEQQLRSEIRASRADVPVRAAATTADDATLRRVQQLLAASEERQQRELALRFTQFVADQNLQRRADMQRISQTFGARAFQVDQEMIRHRQMMNNVIRASVNAPQ